MLALVEPENRTLKTENPSSDSRLPTPDSPVTGDLHPKLPPSGRDFDVFYRVVIEGRPTREAAWAFKISQTRVCQLIKRVREWLWHVLPEAADQPATERLLQMAKHLAADRLEHLYQEALHAWQHSALVEKQTTRRVGAAPLTMIYQSNGKDPKFLTAAGRLAMAQARLGLPEGILMNAQAAIPDDGVLEKNPEIDEETPSLDPPLRACSEDATFTAQPCAQSEAAREVTSDAATACEAHTKEPAALRGESAAPVQPRHNQEESLNVTELQVTPETPGLTMKQLLAQVKDRERLEILDRVAPPQ